MFKALFAVVALSVVIGCSNPVQTETIVYQEGYQIIEYPDLAEDKMFRFDPNEFCTCVFYMETSDGWATISGKANYEEGYFMPMAFGSGVRYRIMLWRCE